MVPISGAMDLEHDYAGLHYIHSCIFVCLNLSECTQITGVSQVRSIIQSNVTLAVDVLQLRRA